jgi:hypothetical protein
LVLASSAGIPPDESGGGKKFGFFSKPIRRLEPIERPAEEAKLVRTLGSELRFKAFKIKYFGLKILSK